MTKRNLKRIMNDGEESTHRRLAAICEGYGATVWPKIGLKEVFSIEKSGIPRSEFSFSLKAHFDFVVCGADGYPIFAVEVDGRYHLGETQKQRDHIKNKLCEKFELPLLRINSKYLAPIYRKMDFLSWCVEIWFLEKGFYEAQARGVIPLDEPFLPSVILYDSTKKNTFPYDLQAETRAKIEGLWKSGACEDSSPSTFLAVDDDGVCWAIGVLQIDDRVGIFAKTAVKNQQFPVFVNELAETVLVKDLLKQLEAVVVSRSRGMPLARCRQEVEAFSREHSELGGGYSSYWGQLAGMPR